MRQDLLEAAVVAGEWHDYPVAERVGYTARAFAQIAGDVVLREVHPRREQNDRLFLAELVLEHTRQPPIRSLGHPGGIVRRLLLDRVVVHEEMLGLDDLPVEGVVLNLILPEVCLRLQRGSHHECGEDQRYAVSH